MIALALIGVLIGYYVAIVYTARLLRLDQAAAVYCALGLTVGVLTLARPKWYWNDLRIQYMRTFLGERAAVTLYCLIAVSLVGTGFWRISRIRQARVQCIADWEGAFSGASNARSDVAVREVRIPDPLRLGRGYQCLDLLPNVQH